MFQSVLKLFSGRCISIRPQSALPLGTDSVAGGMNSIQGSEFCPLSFMRAGREMQIQTACRLFRSPMTVLAIEKSKL